VAAALRQIRSSQISIELEPPGCFDRAGVFFAAVRLTDELVRLQRRVVTATEPCGFIPEDRPYRPHITLARDKDNGRRLQEMKKRLPRAVAFSGFVAHEYALYESFPGPGGSRYEIREQFGLS
jgi:2'-5' RNA ligase